MNVVLEMNFNSTINIRKCKNSPAQVAMFYSSHSVQPNSLISRNLQVKLIKIRTEKAYFKTCEIKRVQEFGNY